MKHRLYLIAGLVVFYATSIHHPGRLLAAEGPTIVANHVAVFDAPPKHVPTTVMPDGPLLGNGDVGVVLAGPPEDQRFYVGKNDFWRRNDPSIEAVAMVGISIPALHGAGYRQEQDIAHAEVRGMFAQNELKVETRSWVDANENMLITELRSRGSTSVEVIIRQMTGAPNNPVPDRIIDNANLVNIGREQHGGGRYYFNGSIEDVKIADRALNLEQIRQLAKTAPNQSNPKPFNGSDVFAKFSQPAMDKAISITARVKIEGVADANYIVSKGDWNEAYSLGLAAGCLRWSINGSYIQSEHPLEQHKWLSIAAVFDGRRMSAYVDGELVANHSSSGDGAIDEAHGVSWITRNADSMPGSRQVAVATRVIGAAAHPNADGALAVTLLPSQPITIVSAVLSDLDARDCLAAARQRVADMKLRDIEKLAEAHRAWWFNFWSRSFIEIPDKEIEKHWYAALYVMGSCSRPGKVAPGLWGNWATTDYAMWHGDFHLNYNFQAPFYIVYSSNHADLSLPFYRAIWESVPNARAMSARHGWKGVHFPVCIGPWGLFPENPDGDFGQRSDAALVALNFIWQYQYTQDTDFLRTTAYPYLIEVANFWEDYLKFENGRYVIYSDSIHEGSGPDFNPLLSLGLVRTLFKNLIPMSEDLGVDENRRAKWKDIGDKISEFPQQQMNGKTVFRYSEKGIAWFGSNTLGVAPIFPAGAIGLNSDPRLLEVSRNTIDAMARWTDENGFSSWYTACARVGYDPKTILLKMHEECVKRSYPSNLLYYGGGGIENCGGFLAVNEMLLQSHEGVIRVFPDWPRDRNARFENLRAVGAFLVSAEIKDGVIGRVKILSEKGRNCSVQNPWPGKMVQVVRNGKPSERMRRSIRNPHYHK